MPMSNCANCLFLSKLDLHLSRHFQFVRNRCVLNVRIYMNLYLYNSHYHHSVQSGHDVLVHHFCWIVLISIGVGTSLQVKRGDSSPTLPCHLFGKAESIKFGLDDGTEMAAQCWMPDSKSVPVHTMHSYCLYSSMAIPYCLWAQAMEQTCAMLIFVQAFGPLKGRAWMFVSYDSILSNHAIMLFLGMDLFPLWRLAHCVEQFNDTDTGQNWYCKQIHRGCPWLVKCILRRIICLHLRAQ